MWGHQLLNSVLEVGSKVNKLRTSLDIGVGKNYDSKLFSEYWALNPKKSIDQPPLFLDDLFAFL